MLKKLITILLLITSITLFADESSPLKASLTPNHSTIAPGQDFEILLEIDLKEGWHAYWKNPGDSGMAPNIEWSLPEGIEITHIDWPTPEKFEMGEAVTYGYSGKAPFLIRAHASQKIEGNNLEISGELQWIVCSNETCLPGVTPVATEIKVGKNPEAHPENGRFHDAKNAFPEKLPLHYIERTLGSAVVCFPDDIALNETPQFFPEYQDYKKTPKIQGKGIEIPLHEDASLKGLLIVGGKAYSMDLKPETTQQGEPLNFLWALLFALVGGLILNLMPCVLPVVSLKVMSFVKMAGNSKKELFKQGLAFTFGVLASFWALAILLIILQTTGQAVGWGFQLQDPLFIAALSLLFIALALNLFGVFEWGMTLASAAGGASAETEEKGYRSSFLNGIFATAVASPCTGPFMGSALGYALSQPAYVSLAIFTALGFGMSLPYLLIGIFPALIRWLPKPGPWMESFKQFLGFLMLATVIWFLWVFNGQTSEYGLFLLITALLIASIGIWVYGKFGALHRTQTSRKISYFTTGILLFASFGIAKSASEAVNPTEINHSDNIGWESFSLEKVEALRAEKKPILIDFTAKWCLICQANHLAITNKDVSKKLEEKGVTLMKADWTRRNPVITEVLKKYGRSGVPLYVLYGESDEPIILPQVLTPEIVMQAVEKHVTPIHVR